MGLDGASRGLVSPNGWGLATWSFGDRFLWRLFLSGALQHSIEACSCVRGSSRGATVGYLVRKRHVGMLFYLLL